MLGIAGEEDKDAPEAEAKKAMNDNLLGKALQRIGEGETGVAKSAFEQLSCNFDQLKEMILAEG
jgi:hypothetical protein